MVTNNDFMLTGKDAIDFDKTLKHPDENALRQRDSFISDVDVTSDVNGTVIVECDDFELQR